MKNKLKKIILEELSEMEARGDIEEGFLDKLMGKETPGSELSKKVSETRKALMDLYKTAGMQKDMALVSAAKEMLAILSKAGGGLGSALSGMASALEKTPSRPKE